MKHGLLISLFVVIAASLGLAQSATKPHASIKGKSAKKAGKTIVRSSRQMAPTPERYRDIQQALVEKGYLKSEPSGIWDAQSSDALRQFQTDQKLSPTGKISSASLIGLGLGPKAAADQPKPAEIKPEQTSPSSTQSER
jgi:hypothetical protein